MKRKAEENLTPDIFYEKPTKEQGLEGVD